MIDYKELQPVLETVLKNAGALLLSYYQQPLVTRYKSDGSLVTEADVASEGYLIGELSRIIPEAALYAEETGKSGNSDYCWVIDPLDGTTNFAHGLPYFCISVALTYKGVPQLGAIYNPVLNEFFYASAGGGAFLNRKPLTMAQPTDKPLGNLVGLPSVHASEYIVVLERLKAGLDMQGYSFRTQGSAALDCAYVACGRLDATLLLNIAWWDIAAGMLMIEQAGGIVTDFTGKTITQGPTSCLGAGPIIHKTLLTVCGS